MEVSANVEIFQMITNSLGIVLFGLAMFLMKGFQTRIDTIITQQEKFNNNQSSFAESLAVLQANDSNKDRALEIMSKHISKDINKIEKSIDIAYKHIAEIKAELRLEIETNKKDMTLGIKELNHNLNNKIHRLTLEFNNNRKNGE